jgi:hypothetical protein
MKRTNLFTLLMLAILAAVPASAQSYLTTTTLSSNITATQTTFGVASATNVQVDGMLYVDHEPMPILAVSGTSVTVMRAQNPAAHASGAQVFVATRALKPLAMQAAIGANKAGLCSTSTSSVRATALAGIAVLPVIDVDTGNVYDCRRNGPSGSWVWNVINAVTFNSVAGSTWAQ